jgi:hypothetical protein
MKAIAVALPPWVDEKKKELIDSGQISIYFALRPLLQWQNLDLTQKLLSLYTAGSGVQLQLEELGKELSMAHAPQTLVARVSVSHILREQLFLHIAYADQPDKTLHAYVLRLNTQGLIMSIRTAHL